MYWLLIGGNYLPLTARPSEMGRTGGGGKGKNKEENEKMGIQGFEDEIDGYEGGNEPKGLADNDVDTSKLVAAY